MANYCNLSVVSEESDNDLEEDIDQNELLIKYSSSDVNESAMLTELAYKNEDTESAASSQKFPAAAKMGLCDTNVSNSEVERRRSSSIKPLTRTKSIFEPTYMMEPKQNQFFVWYKVRNLIQKNIGPLFENFPYNSKTAGNFCKMICNKSVAAVKKKYEWPRYRYVCHVTMFQLNKQGVIVADRSLKFAETDNYAVCLFQKKDSVLIMTFYGIFQE